MKQLPMTNTQSLYATLCHCQLSWERKGADQTLLLGRTENCTATIPKSKAPPRPPKNAIPIDPQSHGNSWHCWPELNLSRASAFKPKPLTQASQVLVWWEFISAHKKNTHLGLATSEAQALRLTIEKVGVHRTSWRSEIAGWQLFEVTPHAKRWETLKGAFIPADTRIVATCPNTTEILNTILSGQTGLNRRQSG